MKNKGISQIFFFKKIIIFQLIKEIGPFKILITFLIIFKVHILFSVIVNQRNNNSTLTK